MIVLNRRAPMFSAPSHGHSKFMVDSSAGRFVLFAFLPDEPVRRDQMLAEIARRRASFTDRVLIAFAITRDAEAFARGANADGLRWLHDIEGAISRGYGVFEAGDPGRWVLLDPMQRVMTIADGAAEDAGLFARLESLPSPDDHAGVPLMAPVLVVPRILDPELCRRLIDFYEARGGELTGVMREINGRTVRVVDGFKRRRDVTINDQDLRMELRGLLEQRLLPEISKAFQFHATRLERYIVACYDAQEGGWFNPHRDNTTAGTAHRRFACSINLNADEFEGGDLRFPEFGSRAYRPPTGGAVVFSCSMLHEATPVTRGRRYAFLPFFYDEAGEAVRQANLHKIDLMAAPMGTALVN